MMQHRQRRVQLTRQAAASQLKEKGKQERPEIGDTP